MLQIDYSRLPSSSPVLLVARSGSVQPDFVLADHASPRFMVARWHRRKVVLDAPAFLDHHLLSYCERGGASSTIVHDGVRRHARQHTGSVTFLPAGRYERWVLDAPCEVAHLHLYITGEAMHEGLLADPASASTSRALSPMLDVRHPWFDSFFRLLTAEHEACGQGNRLQEFDLFDRMGQLLLRRLIALQRHPGATDQPGRTAPLRPQLLRDVLAYIDRHLASKIVLDQLAAVASMCVDHFVRAFEQATGTTPHRWVLERRLEISRLRLRETTDAVGVIARECGFSGAAHFAAAFRRFHGTTPSAYRRGA